jgi:hypothetical protein
VVGEETEVEVKLVPVADRRVVLVSLPTTTDFEDNRSKC